MTTPIQNIPCEASPDCLHVACQHCGKPIRLGSQPSPEHPGTRQGTLKNQACQTCHKHGGKPEPIPPTPDKCVQCAHPMRPSHTPVKDKPGTRTHGARGLCHTCYLRSDEYLQSIDHDPCIDCDRPLRRLGSPVALAPGTVQHYAGGRCRPCYNAHQTQRAATPPPNPEPKKLADNDLEELKHRNYGAYLFTKRRRERAAKRKRAQLLGGRM